MSSANDLGGAGNMAGAGGSGTPGGAPPAARTPGSRTPGGRMPGGRTLGGRTPGGRSPGGAGASASGAPGISRDLGAGRLNAVSRADWADPDAVLVDLYRQAEGKAIEAIDWYLREKTGKKRASRYLRAVAIVLASAGGMFPLFALAAPAAVPSAAWGYVLLALAAACVAFDRFFGVSSGWMRYMIAAQRLQGRLDRFQYEWTAICADAANGGGALTIADRLELLKAFSTDVGDLVMRETVEWEQEFRSNLSRLEAEAAVSARPNVGPSRR